MKKTFLPSDKKKISGFSKKNIVGNPNISIILLQHNNYIWDIPCQVIQKNTNLTPTPLKKFLLWNSERYI